MKKILTAAGIVVLALGLSACGGGAPANPNVVDAPAKAPTEALVVYRVTDPETGERIRCVASKYANDKIVPDCDWKGE